MSNLLFAVLLSVFLAIVVVFSFVLAGWAKKKGRRNRPDSPLLLLFLLCLLPFPSHAQDYQARLLIHPQMRLYKNTGVAGWFILPDIDDDKGEHQRRLIVSGIMYQDSSRWIEVMKGVLDLQTKPNEGLINIRASERSFKPFSMFLDLHMYKRRMLLAGFIDKSLIKRMKTLKVGIETEHLLFQGKPDLHWVGMRVSYQLPKLPCLPIYKNASVACVYQFGIMDANDFFRSYFLINF